MIQRLLSPLTVVGALAAALLTIKPAAPVIPQAHAPAAATGGLGGKTGGATRPGPRAAKATSGVPVAVTGSPVAGRESARALAPGIAKAAAGGPRRPEATVAPVKRVHTAPAAIERPAATAMAAAGTRTVDLTRRQPAPIERQLP